MGKKSKRNRSKNNCDTTAKSATIGENETEEVLENTIPPSLRPNNENETETADNLRFEDPFPDQFEEEDIVSDNDEDNNDNDDDNRMEEDVDNDKPVPWTPWGCSPEEKLEIDPRAYKMHHALTAEWPSLSFDFVKDTLGENRTRFPHSFTAVIGSQAAKPNQNKITIMSLSDLGKMERSGDDSDDSDDDSSDDDDSAADKKRDKDLETDSDPILEHYSMKHWGGVNRLRTWGSIAAVWGDQGTVCLYDLSPTLQKLQRSQGHGNKNINNTSYSSHSNNTDPFFTYSGHKQEGYAMDWSPAQAGHLATGDCEGGIHLWTPTEPLDSHSSAKQQQWDHNSFSITPFASSPSQTSVEDIQWSPSESTVFAAAECHGRIKIYDTRRPGKAMLDHLAHGNKSDVNVISWNKAVTNLLASGSDDGVFSVWDLRSFSSSANKCKPLARFTPHDKPIVSLEWHPTDESMIVVSDDDATYIYDLSIEAEAETEDTQNSNMMADNDNAALQKNKIPPQMLFMHCGSTLTKEVHWHPQITSMVMTTASSGFSVFIPVNL